MQYEKIVDTVLAFVVKRRFRYCEVSDVAVRSGVVRDLARGRCTSI